MRLPTQQHTDRGRLDVKMTPMIDIVFLLIIFFLVSSHLAKQEVQLDLDLPAAESGREERFRKRLDAQRQHDKTLDKRFEGLLKKAKDGGPPERFTRDIDLD